MGFRPRRPLCSRCAAAGSTGAVRGIFSRSDLIDPTNVFLRDSLVTTSATPSATAAVDLLVDTGSSMTFNAVGSTFVGRGASPAAVRATRAAAGSGALTATLRNSIARSESAPGVDLLADRATIGADFSSFNTRTLAERRHDSRPRQREQRGGQSPARARLQPPAGLAADRPRGPRRRAGRRARPRRRGALARRDRRLPAGAGHRRLRARECLRAPAAGQPRAPAHARGHDEQGVRAEGQARRPRRRSGGGRRSAARASATRSRSPHGSGSPSSAGCVAGSRASASSGSRGWRRTSRPAANPPPSAAG